MDSYAFTVARTNVRKFSLHHFSKNPSLLEGEVHLEIEKYAFTANNITYAVLGEELRYFQFFPALDPIMEVIIPVWGIGRVVRSLVPEVKIGSRFYGFFPMAKDLVTLPGKVRDTGFTDTKPHRTNLPAVYNYYSDLKVDEMHRDQFEDLELVFRPLFTTSFLIDDYLALNQFFNSDQILITSASSKTAIALVYLLQLRKSSNPNLKIIALTSKSNYGFVNALGCYDEVYLYDQIEEIKKEKTTIIDFRGNQDFLKQLKLYFESQLNFLSLVGLVQWEERKKTTESSIGTVFFAPHQVKRRAKEWGLDGFQKKLSQSWQNFLPFADQKFKIQLATNPEDIEKIYMQNLEGKVPPNLAYVISHS